MLSIWDAKIGARGYYASDSCLTFGVNVALSGERETKTSSYVLLTERKDLGEHGLKYFEYIDRGDSGFDIVVRKSSSRLRSIRWSL